MNRRLIAAALFLVLATPVTALADASADGLGPAASAPGTGASSADSASLQPAGTSPLQSSNNGSGQATSGDAGTLQQPATSDNSQLQVLVGNDADGTSHGTNGSHSAWWYVLWIGLGLVLISTGLWLWRRLQRPAAPAFSVPSLAERPAPRVEDDDTPDELTEAAIEDDEDTTGAEPTAVETVQTDEDAPPIVGINDEKTGDDGGQVAVAKPKAARKPIKKRHKRARR